MKNLNHYITEAWSGVKKQSLKQEIEAWCEEMGIENYTINSKGEIDVDGNVDLYMDDKGFKELPYKFGMVDGYFSLSDNKNLISLKNCPDYVKRYFSCEGCISLDSLEGCPKKVGRDFYCNDCKREFTEKEVLSKCKVKGDIHI